MSVKHAAKPGPISKVPGKTIIPQNVPEVPATSPARGLKHIRLLTICLIALATFLLFHAGPSAARERLPGEPCQIDHPRDPETKKNFIWTEPERWVWTQVCEGKIADFNIRYSTTLDPKSPDGWKKNRELRGTFLEAILLHEPFSSALTHKGVRIIGAWFREKIDLESAEIDHEVWLDWSRVENSVKLSGARTGHLLSLEGSTFLREVILSRAKFGGQLNMVGSKFIGKLDMDSMEVSGNLIMRGKAEFGDVRLRAAKIGGQLDMTGSKFTGKLDMDSMTIGSHLFMRRGAEFKGGVNLRSMKIGGTLQFAESTFLGSQVDLTELEVHEEILFEDKKWGRPTWGEKTRLILRNARAGAIQDTDKDGVWPNRLELEGFQYDRLGGVRTVAQSAASRRPPTWYVDWLKRDVTYSPQPYEQLAKVLRDMGLVDKANTVLFAMRERERRIA